MISPNMVFSLLSLVQFFSRSAHRRFLLPGRVDAVPLGGAPYSLADLVSSLRNHSSEVHQAEQGEQVHNVVENEHLYLLSLL
jgi:hypothetical protein